MAKKGLTVIQRKNILSAKSKNEGWSLCVGAGVSYGAFPDWKELVVKIATKDCCGSGAELLITNLAKKLSLDALIQTAQNRLGLTSVDFASELSKCLFENVKLKLGKNWPKTAKALSAVAPGDLTPTEWASFIDVIERNYPQISALSIARVVGDLVGREFSPDSIISFNAETLLYALITAQLGKNGTVSATHITHQKKSLDRVTQALTRRKAKRIPYYHCHGILPIPEGTLKFHKEIGIDKLVFSEGDYLHLANSSFSWQSSVFLGACSFNSLVFIGVSLADSNIRRWLSWVHKNRVNELLLRGEEADSTSHYWINVEPSDKNEKLWIEASVAHLGVRLVWITDWNETEACLRDMTGIV